MGTAGSAGPAVSVGAVGAVGAVGTWRERPSTRAVPAERCPGDGHRHRAIEGERSVWAVVRFFGWHATPVCPTACTQQLGSRWAIRYARGRGQSQARARERGECSPLGG